MLFQLHLHSPPSSPCLRGEFPPSANWLCLSFSPLRPSTPLPAFHVIASSVAPKQSPPRELALFSINTPILRPKTGKLGSFVIFAPPGPFRLVPEGRCVGWGLPQRSLLLPGCHVRRRDLGASVVNLRQETAIGHVRRRGRGIVPSQFPTDHSSLIATPSSFVLYIPQTRPLRQGKSRRRFVTLRSEAQPVLDLIECRGP